MKQRILVAGIGNIFLGDDAFGVEVAQRLARRRLPEGVRVVDFGIRGFDLACALLESDEVAILVDAIPRGEEPGTLYVIEPDLDAIGEGEHPVSAVEPHSMDPVKVLRFVKAMGGRSKRVLLVGCEPATIGEDEGGQMGLSAPVEGALEEAVGLVESLVGQILNEAAAPVESTIGRCHDEQRADADGHNQEVIQYETAH